MSRHLRRHEARRLAQEVHNAASLLASGRSAICRNVGLSPERWRALAVIVHSPLVLSVSDLARRLRLSRQSVHRLALGLARAGWIQYLPNSDDRRLLQLEITASGKRILDEAEYRFTTWLTVMTYDLSEHELRQMVSAVRCVRERIARVRDHAQ
jgi:DNA-binding MarR family transcriptional regulator